MLNFKFDPNSHYLVACTYGPDSMSLLDMMQKDGVKPIVCFVNYHKVVESDEDQKDLAAYCKGRDLSLEIFDTKKDLTPEQRRVKGEDFKEWARRIRYDFFKVVYKKYNAAAIFVAHQQDDLIETYLLEKKQKKAKGGQYGWNEISTMVTEFGMSDLGPIQYEKDTGSVFLGRDYANTQRNFSTQIAFEIDKAVRQIIDEAHAEFDRIFTKINAQIEQGLSDAEKEQYRATMTKIAANIGADYFFEEDK